MSAIQPETENDKETRLLLFSTFSVFFFLQVVGLYSILFIETFVRPSNACNNV